MKSPASKSKSVLQKKVSPITGIVVAIIIIAIVGGIYAYKSTQVSEVRDAPLIKSFDTMMEMKKAAKERWDKELAAAKAEGRAPNEAFRPSPNMAPINGRAPMRMGGFADRGGTIAPAGR